ncbi:hypothetical protein V9T20_12985 (plasmid) [Halobacterium salinarum]|uniref:hypothetical protein n=1 Tax=Halobacterium salinarum TaxID=2242 RepID=UPI0030CB3BF3
MGKMEQNADTDDVYGVQLARARDAPTRFAFATLTLSTRLWAGLVIGLPLACLLLSPVHDVFITAAAGLPFGISLLLLWFSHEFANSQLRVDTAERTLVKSKPYGVGQYSPVDADDVGHVSIIQLSDVALVNLHYTGPIFSKPPDATITAAQIDDVKSQLEEMGLEVSIQKVTPQLVPIDPILARIVVTPIALLGTLLVVWFVYGIEPFLSNSVIVPTIVLIGYGLYGVIWRYRLRRSDSENGQNSR